jgi:tryptophan-rich sensory protein
MKPINLKRLLTAIAIPELVGAASAFITGNMGEVYNSYKRPPLSPPGIVFPIVWVILYALMGIASYLVSESTAASRKDKKDALLFYAVQLVVNFIWPIIFFKFEAYRLAAVVIVALLVLVVITAFKFRKIDITAFRLMIPYILWLIFATYLNIGVAVLN